MGNKLAIIYYTPIEDPDKIEKIELRKEKEYKIVKEKIQEVTKRRRKPELKLFQSTRISEIRLIEKIKKDFPSIELENIRELFDRLTDWLYGRAKSKGKYFGLIVNSKFIFIYHFKSERSIDYTGGIKVFIKYLDADVINWFLFLSLDTSALLEFCDIPKNELEAFDKTAELLYAYDKRGTKGFKEMVSTQPIYESKGEIKIRSEYDPDTDIVIETHLEHIGKLENSINLDLREGKVTINGLPLNIKEVEIDGKKYPMEESKLIFIHIYHNLLKIQDFINEVEYFLKGCKSPIIVEQLERIVIKDGEKEVKILNKPSREFKDKVTIYLLGNLGVNIDAAVFHEKFTNILTRLDFSIVEISRLSEKYDITEIGSLTLFLKFKNTKEIIKIFNTFSRLINNLKGEGMANQFYKRFLTLVALMTGCRLVQNKNIRDMLYTCSKKAITGLLSQLSEQKYSMELKEINKLGIELKTGLLEDGTGFFDPSAPKFAKKLIEKTKKKREDLIIYLVGINEDAKGFTPIPLDRIRNEFLGDVEEILSEAGYLSYLIEAFPINNKEGILCIALSRGKL